MPALAQWVNHFRRMAANELPPGSRTIVSQKGKGPQRTFYRVQPFLRTVSNSQSAVDQASSELKTINKIKPGRKRKPNAKPKAKKRDRLSKNKLPFKKRGGVTKNKLAFKKQSPGKGKTSRKRKTLPKTSDTLQ